MRRTKGWRPHPRQALWAAAGLLAAAALGTVLLLHELSSDSPAEFWRQKGQLTGVQITPAGGDSLYDAYQLVLGSSAGWSVGGHLRAPRSAGRWPAIVVLGGIDTGGMAAELFEPETPYVILGLDYPWDGPTRLGWLQFLVRLLKIRRAMLLTPSAVLLALDYLETRPDVDGSGPVLVGASFGAQLMVVAGALDPRAGPVLSLYGGGDYGALVEQSLKKSGWPGWLRSFAGWIIERLLDPVEPLHYAARIAPRPLIVINGTRDDRIPRRSAVALYEAARQPKRLIWLDEGHISPRDTAQLHRVLHVATEALEAEAGGRPAR